MAIPTSTELADIIVNRWPNADVQKVIKLLDEVREHFEERRDKQAEAAKKAAKSVYFDGLTLTGIWDYYNSTDHCMVSVSFDPLPST